MMSLSVNKFPKFDVVSDVSDHHFAGKYFKSQSTPSPSVRKKIMQEWKLISKDLPETIFARAYETRVDLLRAAIVGVRGTPYHDGLFFFDIAFPSDYPATPPLVYYQSFGYRINPNLYDNGRVCLSLLNTWTGIKCENWDPNNSTILQLLLSIQALILNEKPFFNEPLHSRGCAGEMYWDKKSLAYNEDVFVLSCKTMLRVLRSPPKNFKALVNQHFKDRAEFILNACDAYRKGLAEVGLFDGVLKGTEREVSVKFEDALNQVYGDLVVALSNTGVSIEQFVQQVKEAKEQKAKEKKMKAKEKYDAAENKRGFIQKLKKIVSLGLFMKNKSQKSKTIPV